MFFLTSPNPIRVFKHGFWGITCAALFLFMLFGGVIPGITKEQDTYHFVSNISEITDSTKYPNGSYVLIKARINPETAIAFEEEGDTKYHYVVKLQENEKVAVYFDKDDIENISTIESDSSLEGISQIPEREYYGRIFPRSSSLVYIDIKEEEIDFKDGSNIERIIEVGSKPANNNNIVTFSTIMMVAFLIIGVINFYIAFKAWKG